MDGVARPAGRRPSRVPERTCIGCRRRAGKTELVRIARRPDGRVEVDRDGGPGRGAYVHPDGACVAAAGRRLGGALRVKGIHFEAIVESVLKGPDRS